MTRLKEILEKDAKLVHKNIKLDEMSGKHIIITGATGLVGINFIMSLKDSFKNKKPPKITAVFHNEIPDYFKDILNFKNLTLKKGDITNPIFIESLPRADYIIHSAGYGQPGKFMQDKIKTIEINTTATISLFKKLKKGGKFLFISTSEIYSGSKSPYKENMIGTTTPQHPRACYIEGKRCGEAICMVYKEKGYDVKIARLSLAYGPGTKKADNRVLNELIEKGLKGEIKLLDKGNAARTYCYIKDAVEILFNILLKGTKTVYNVGGKSKTTIGSLAKMIAEITKSDIILGKNSVIGSPDNVELDMSMTLSEFPILFTELKEGIIKTINYQKKLYE